jgi:hypothetical protein
MLGALAASNEARKQWATDQRALARAVGLSIEDWLIALDAASARTSQLTAAVVGAAMAKGLGLSVLDGLDGQALASLARTLIDPRPPRVRSPLLKEAVRRAEELGTSRGGRLLKRPRRDPLPTPQRETRPVGESSDVATPDSPGTKPGPLRAPVRDTIEGDSSVADSTAKDLEDQKPK